MIYRIVMLLFCAINVLMAENIAPEQQIRKLQSGATLKEGGFYSGYHLEFLKQNSNTHRSAHSINIGYGLLQNLDISLELPYHLLRDTVKKIDGMGDLMLGAKYGFPNSDQTWQQALSLGLSLPTGYDNLDSDFSGVPSLHKKGFSLDYLLTYRADKLALHGNFGFRALDNIERHRPEDLLLRYRLGFDYQLNSVQNRGWWVKWEFETDHALYDMKNEIRGSQFLGLYEKVESGFAFHVGLIQQIYRDDALGFQVGLTYHLPGKNSVVVPKLFDQYSSPALKVGLMTFANEDTLRQKSLLINQLQERISRLNGVKSIILNTNDDLAYNNEALIQQAKVEGYQLLLFGKIRENGFVQEPLLYLPPLLNKPQILHRLKVDVLIVDVVENKIVWQEEVQSEKGISFDTRFLTVDRIDGKVFLNELEKQRLVKENYRLFVDLLIKKLK